MTWTEQAWVEEHSPYEGGAYATHLVIAGIVNPDREYELYINPDNLRKRCHCSLQTLRRQLAKMVEDGYLKMLNPGGGRGNFATYRFVRKPTQNDQVSTDANLPISDANLPISDAQTYPSQDPVLLPKKELKKEKEKAAAASLCDFLQRGIAHHTGGEPPKIYVAWCTEMSRLLRLGPTSWEKERPIPEEEVRTVIRGVFTKLNVLSNSGFCWADQIRSPSNLRKHWDELILALKDRPKQQGTSGDSNFLMGKVKESYAKR